MMFHCGWLFVNCLLPLNIMLIINTEQQKLVACNILDSHEIGQKKIRNIQEEDIFLSNTLYRIPYRVGEKYFMIYGPFTDWTVEFHRSVDSPKVWNSTVWGRAR